MQTHISSRFFYNGDKIFQYIHYPPEILFTQYKKFQTMVIAEMGEGGKSGFPFFYFFSTLVLIICDIAISTVQ